MVVSNDAVALVGLDALALVVAMGLSLLPSDDGDAGASFDRVAPVSLDDGDEDLPSDCWLAKVEVNLVAVLGSNFVLRLADVAVSDCSDDLSSLTASTS